MGALQVGETVEASAATPAGNFLIKHESNAVKGSLPQKKKKLSLDGKDQSLKKTCWFRACLAHPWFRL